MDDADDEGVSFVFTIQPSLSLHRQADDDPMAGGDEYDNDDDTQTQTLQSHRQSLDPVSNFMLTSCERKRMMPRGGGRVCLR